MADNDAFLQAIIENPEDDSLRLIYADWLEEHGQPERSEFIRVQIELARMPAGDPRRRELEARERELLEENEQEWTRPFQGLVKRWGFRRGLVEVIEVENPDFLTQAGDIFRLAPIRHADFWTGGDDVGRLFPRLSRSPWLARLKILSLNFGICAVGDAQFATLAGLPPLLQRLSRIFVLECPLSPLGLRPVLMSPYLFRLEQVYLSECELRGPAGVEPLAQSFRLKGLKALTLSRNGLKDGGVQALVVSPNCAGLELLDLAECDLGDAGAEALARSPHLGRLKALHLSGNGFTDAGAEVLAASPYLAGLDALLLDGNQISDRGAQALAASPHLDRLRALVLWGNRISQSGEEELQRRFSTRVHF